MEALNSYRSLVPSETRYMCDLLSTALTVQAKPIKNKQSLDPVILLNTLKRHKLFPVFYDIWHKQPEINEPDWQQFDINLKQLTEINRIKMIQKSTALVRIVERFAGEGIPVIALKGPATAQMLYGNVGMKASLDLDILIDIKNWDRALIVLHESGFIASPASYELNGMQKEYLFNNFNHIELHCAGNPLVLELHWALYSNKYMMEVTFDELYNKSEIMELAGTRVSVLCPLHQALYLMAHGAWHQWARLDWLYDFTTFMHRHVDVREKLDFEATRLGLKTIMAQSFILSHLFFGTDIEICTGKSIGRRNLWLVTRAINAIQYDYNNKFKTFPRFAYKLYQTRLKSSFRYKVSLWIKAGTNMKDWETVQLPESLFFLYFLIRPFLYFYRIVCNAWRS